MDLVYCHVLSPSFLLCLLRLVVFRSSVDDLEIIAANTRNVQVSPFLFQDPTQIVHSRQVAGSFIH